MSAAITTVAIRAMVTLSAWSVAEDRRDRRDGGRER